jgi:hypothetical protein
MIRVGAMGIAERRREYGGSFIASCMQVSRSQRYGRTLICGEAVDSAGRCSPLFGFVMRFLLWAEAGPSPPPVASWLRTCPASVSRGGPGNRWETSKASSLELPKTLDIHMTST